MVLIVDYKDGKMVLGTQEVSINHRSPYGLSLLLNYIIQMKHGREPTFPWSVGVGLGCVIVSLNVSVIRFSITAETNPWTCLLSELLD